MHISRCALAITMILATGYERPASAGDVYTPCILGSNGVRHPMANQWKYTQLVCPGGQFVAVRTDGKVVASNVPSSITFGQAVSRVPEYGLPLLALDAQGNVLSLSDWCSLTEITLGYPYEAILPPPDLGTCQKLAIGQAGFVLALQSDGTVRAWGPHAPVVNLPADLGACVDIAAPTNLGLAVRADGTVRIWGNTGGSTILNPPSWVAGIKKIAASQDHVVAIRVDGTVACWGANSIGKCNVPPGLTDVIAVAASTYHSVAVRADGSVVCWGDNSAGQCSVPAGLRACVGVIAETFRTMALLSDGSVVGWGGDAPQISTLAFAEPKVNERRIRMGPGLLWSIAKDGTLHYEQSNSAGPIFVPHKAVGLTWRLTSAGALHIPFMAVPFDGPVPGTYTAADGFQPVVAVTAMGTLTQFTGPAPGFPVIPEGNNFVDVAVGATHLISLTSDGSVVASGMNEYGQCDVPVGLSGVLDIATGWYHNAAVRSDGSVICWGLNDCGQCDVPRSLGPVRQVETTRGSTLAILEDGSVVRWGHSTEVPEIDRPASWIGAAGAKEGGEEDFVIITDTDQDDDGLDDELDNCPLTANPSQADCDGDGQGDECEIQDGTATDCDGNGIPDQCNPALADCDSDGSPDLCEIQLGAPDQNSDGVPDDCQCLADLNGDQMVNGADISILLGYWGSGAPSADVDGDGLVGGADLSIVLGAWGACK